ncbi:Uncharacterized protein ALO64_03374 [Pseudomonas meliae]|uniref:Uncharacterized protein n=1 Tax=Pseudomonas meliae TaxID=86176 RepID=A0A0P9WVG7_9PSED|nr:Uncharacterized protein ALO64_03374 [Pseudomonas meliae]
MADHAASDLRKHINLAPAHAHPNHGMRRGNADHARHRNHACDALGGKARSEMAGREDASFAG